MPTTYQEDGGTTTLPQTRTERQFSNASASEVVKEYEQRWNLAVQLVETLFDKADQSIDKGAYPAIPQTVIGIVTNLFGFTPRNGWSESELHSKAEALPGSQKMVSDLVSTR